MPMELHAFQARGPGSSPGGSKIRGHSSMAEHEVSSNPCRRAFMTTMSILAAIYIRSRKIERYAVHGPVAAP